jgi:hypothetical protein
VRGLWLSRGRALSRVPTCGVQNEAQLEVLHMHRRFGADAAQYVQQERSPLLHHRHHVPAAHPQSPDAGAGSTAVWPCFALSGMPRKRESGEALGQGRTQQVAATKGRVAVIMEGRAPEIASVKCVGDALANGVPPCITGAADQVRSNQELHSTTSACACLGEAGAITPACW